MVQNKPLQQVFIGALLACMWATCVKPTWAGQAALDAWKNAPPTVRARALKLARQAFDAYVLHHHVIQPPSSLPGLMREGGTGVFVSTMVHGAPRCCMGTLYPTCPSTACEIIQNAVAAAGWDRRFPPIRLAELPHLTLILSLVGTPQPLGPTDLSSLDPVRDGLAARYNARFGVVLSGETDTVQRMVKWARIRSGAGPKDAVEWFRIRDVRIVEKHESNEQGAVRDKQ